jgi:aarF domain-containing kinase
MEDPFDETMNLQQTSFHRSTSLTDLAPQSEAEMDAIRSAVMNQEGLLISVFDVLRRVPRRVLMVLKLNELTRCVIYLCCFPFYGYI